jgi:hypothetical protein
MTGLIIILYREGEITISGNSVVTMPGLAVRMTGE